jgi:UDP:flavonoid glycosyltransferase YjiC (YdhE family)
VAEPYLPQLAVLERATVFVTHAGTNSVSEAMYYGVPLLALPICNEEPVQAYYVERAKVGLQLEPFSCTAAEVEDALRRLLDPSADCRSGIPEVRRSYRELNGARRAAELIANAAT